MKYLDTRCSTQAEANIQAPPNSNSNVRRCAGALNHSCGGRSSEAGPRGDSIQARGSHQIYINKHPAMLQSLLRARSALSHHTSTIHIFSSIPFRFSHAHKYFPDGAQAPIFPATCVRLTEREIRLLILEKGRSYSVSGYRCNKHGKILCPPRLFFYKRQIYNTFVFV